MMAPETIKTSGDVAAGALAVTTLMAWLPPVAAALSIIWVITRLIEADYTNTTKRFRWLYDLFRLGRKSL